MGKIDKGNCRSCRRKIQQGLHNKCLYCGKALDADQCFTDEEKASILAAMNERLALERIETEKKRKLHSKSENGSDFYINITCGVEVIGPSLALTSIIFRRPEPFSEYFRHMIASPNH